MNDRRKQNDQLMAVATDLSLPIVVLPPPHETGFDHARIARVRREIENGTYENLHRLNGAVEKLLPVIDRPDVTPFIEQALDDGHEDEEPERWDGQS